MRGALALIIAAWLVVPSQQSRDDLRADENILCAFCVPADLCVLVRAQCPRKNASSPRKRPLTPALPGNREHTADVPCPHSSRRTAAGSTRDARWAGTEAARAATI